MVLEAPLDRALTQRTDRWRAVDNELTRLAETATPKVRTLFRAEARIIDKVLAAGGPASLEYALDAVSEEEWTRLLETLWVANGEVYFSRTLAELEGLKAAKPKLSEIPEALAEIGRSVIARAEAIVANTKRRIEDTARRVSLETTEDLGRLMRSEISGLYSKWEAGRSAAIARHNVLTATAHAQHAAARSSGILLEKEWVSMQDDRVRPAHRTADGQTVGLEAKYIVGGEDLRYPRDPAGSVANTANCRCQEIYKPVETTVTRQQLSDAADNLLAEAQEIEDQITRLLEDWADEFGGTMDGTDAVRAIIKKDLGLDSMLDSKFKTAGSLRRKLQSELADLGPGASLQDAVDKINDALRYTMTLPEEGFASGMKSTINRFRQQGITIPEGGAKKFWVEGNSYFGSNYSFTHPNGHVFELQFHTPQSSLVKYETLHPLYEQQRVLPKGDPLRQELADRMQAASDTVTIPPGLDDVFGVYRAKWFWFEWTVKTSTRPRLSR